MLVCWGRWGKRKGAGSVQRAGREGWWQDRGGTGGAGQGSGTLGGGTGSSVTCPPLTEAICCRERDRRWGGEEQTLEKKK